MITIEDILERTSDLPTIPAAALKVIRESDSSTSNAASIARTLSQDQALSVRVLRLANSAYYGMARRISNLQEAVVILGMKSVKNLALVASSYPWLSKPLKGYALGPKQLWTHSFGVAVGAQFVAERAKLDDDGTIFTAGLLSDIGKVALSVWLENKVTALYSLAVHQQLTFAEAEQKVLGFDHCEVGEHLAIGWNLPEEIVQAIRYHHEPNSALLHRNVVDCVHVGDYLTTAMGFGLGGDGLQYRFYEESLQRLNLATEDLDQVTDAFVTAYENYELLFEELVAA